jgi:hypothetical protein
MDMTSRRGHQKEQADQDEGMFLFAGLEGLTLRRWIHHTWEQMQTWNS